jgi:two-component sensor histidine kinase/PAS domain-containing protein
MAKHPHAALYDDPRLAEAIIATIQQPLLVLEENLTVLRANPAFLRAFQVDDDQVRGQAVYDLGNGQWQIPELRDLLGNVAGKAERLEDFRVAHDFPSIGERVMLLNAFRIDSDGERPPLILLSINDITALEQARYALEGQKEYAEKLTDSIREALLVLDWDLRVKHANLTFYETFKVDPGETEGRMVYELGNGQWNIPVLRELLEDILPKEDSFDDFEVRHEFEDIGERVMILNGRRLDHLNLILLAIEDVTERERSHRRQQILARELSHRVKNILTLVNALASQTAKKAASLEDFIEIFRGRVQALARAHEQWLADDMSGADLRALVAESVEGCGADLRRFNLEGPRVGLQPEQTMPLNLTFHELCTNAIKYGALSNKTGQIHVSWSVGDDGQLRLLWKESGGPAAEAPEAKSFGMELIERLGPHELNGRTELHFEQRGLECELTFPLSKA